MHDPLKNIDARPAVFPITRRVLLFFAAFALPCAVLAQSEYSLGNPIAPVLRNTTDASQNAWLSGNDVVPITASYILPTAEGAPTSVKQIAGLPQFRLSSGSGAFVVENAKPDFNLGDQIAVPEGVNWPATYEDWLANPTEQRTFLFDNIGERVFVINSGAATFKWVMKDGSETEVTYNLSPVAAKRPFRVFWTEQPYNAPPINLSGKFVKLFGPDTLVNPKRGVITNFVGGITQVVSNNIVSGVFFDPSTDLLRVYGEVEGQFIMAYYDSGSYDRIKHVQTIEVGRPAVVEQAAEIGRAVRPAGSGYNPVGLTALPQSETPSDNRGPFYYQHKGAHSYSPKNGQVYPLRDTSDAPWRLPVYWMEEDSFGTLWPFELCHYSASWPKDSRRLIAGAKVPIPKAFSAELMAYQEPEGHATAPVDNIFETQAGGHSLLRLTGDDNVWFIPVCSVEREDPDYFNLEKSLVWNVGRKIIPPEGMHICHVPGYHPPVDSEYPGHINTAVSMGNYNAEIYKDPLAASDDSSSQTNLISGTGGDTNVYPSVIYAVNTAEAPIEVWWSGSEQQEGMKEKVPFACAIDRYQIVWPETDMVPQIVLASGQGSIAPCVMRDGGSAVFTGKGATMPIQDRAFFGNDGGCVSFWVCESSAAKPPDAGAVLSIGEIAGPRLRIDRKPGGPGVSYTATFREAGTNGLTARISSPMIPKDGTWHKVVFSYTHNPFAAAGESSMPVMSIYVDGEVVALNALNEPLNTSGVSYGNVIGAYGEGRPASVGTMIDDILFRNEPGKSESEMDLYIQASRNGSGVTTLISFDQGWTEGNLDQDHRIVEEVQGTYAFTSGIRISVPGIPRMVQESLISDTTPIVYGQRDQSKPGYNPNEEHGFIMSGGEGYNVWALRCDLNTEETSRPFVLAEYTRNGEKWMKAYAVVVTNSFHPELAGDMTVGTLLPGPHPLDMMDNPWLPENTWENTATANVYRDRKKQLWCRAPGSFQIQMFYANQAGFDYPSLETNPAVGTPIPWLGYLNGDQPGGDVLTRSPAPWTWRASWPEKVETMRIGQTLTKAAAGLPEVWNAKSLAVVYPDDEAAKPFRVRDRVLLYDPTVAIQVGPADSQTLELGTTMAYVKALGFEVGPKGVATLRAGRYKFNDLPPSISDRFYIDSNLPLDKCVCFEGALVEKTGGASILYPNVLLPSEREAIKNLLAKEHPLKYSWDVMIDFLAILPQEPTECFISDKSTRNELVSIYRPRDHYALTAMGDTGHVVLIENDGPKEGLGVEAGDPISMHVFAVTNEYYTGRVVTRENPRNLLSQQLDVLYTEAFAGDAKDFIFEWKKATPGSDGRVPMDFESGYTQRFPLDDTSKGLTRFTIGQQGDTLVNMVNTYYVVRYRAANHNTAAYATMGDRWSDWCGPALAEGWVQRVLNNVTPFTQRMRDLYENPAETPATMIQQAGAPYEGDIAMNQDNLTSVGLIQLYQTLLNKAESMSLTLKINDRDANKQLQLAAARLADLYMVLGNEALSDALNPTIGFGSTSNIRSADFPGNCGSYFSSLFCFDNQVQSLLDEELALLRGRSGANAPFIQTPPFYNRLIWNFTKGIHAGEVAYAVNYNINSSNGDAVIDAEDAARQYPQGHGDAYGHYLSALSGYYRLLRNPYYSWGPPSMGEMVVNDAVVNVDYYDEARFAEIADKVAETAALVTDRTARKAWRDNGSASGAGYMDEDEARAFGYGEWGTRGGVGAVVNWMLANSLLPQGPDATEAYVLGLEPNSMAYMIDTPLRSGVFDAWTFEVQFTGASTLKEGSPLLYWGQGTNQVSITLSPNGTAKALVQAFEITSEGNEVREITNNLYEVSFGSFPSNSLIAISCDQPDAAPTIRLFNLENEALVSLNTLPAELNLAWIRKAVPIVGSGISGRISELRFWDRCRANDELTDRALLVSPRTEHLLAYSRGISDEGSGSELPDEVNGSYVWYIENPVWTSSARSGQDIAFTDKGLLRIDRTTAPALVSLPKRVEDIQATLDRMDRGLNPLGLSQQSIAFDITPIGEGDESKTHFEQIAARAKIALANAAAVLDNVQEISSRLRLLENSNQSEEESAASEERLYNSQLIELYGYPYSSDIGPGGTYVQGYDGPDLFHFMWMDTDQFGIEKVDDKNDLVLTYKLPDWAGNKFLANYVLEDRRHEMSWTISANGMVKKPDSIQGKRRATGAIQQAYADFLSAYARTEAAVDWYQRKKAILDHEKVSSEMSLAMSQVKLVVMEGLAIKSFIKEKANFAAKLALIQIESGTTMMRKHIDMAVKATPKIAGAGLTVNMDPQALVSAALAPFETGINVGGKAGEVALRTAILGYEDKTLSTLIKSLLSNASEFASKSSEIRLKLRETLEAEWNAAMDVQKAYADLICAYDDVDALVAKGERLQSERESKRAQRVNRLTKLRYNDMFYRQQRSEALQRYEAAYALAQKYVFLAAQAYDYETAQLSSDRHAGNEFRAEIIGARSIGRLGEDGKALLSDGIGEAGLSDILARMEADWLVLKPRLGINNPERNTTWFSLRRELFRIDPMAAGDDNWRSELMKYWVDDLRSLPEYRRYCQPFTSSSGLANKEPGFVISFSTDIDFGENFFGKPLQAGDSAFDSTYFSTKISSAGIRFIGYNERINGYTGAETAFSATPVVYLMPLGADRMRVPGGGEEAEILDYSVIDQVVPAPYRVGSSHLDQADWQPFYDGRTGGADSAARIRRYPSFRVDTGMGSDVGHTSTRLTGRSAWNTRWVIIIPAGSMCGGDAEARKAVRNLFLRGKDVDRDGTPDISGVRDIQLGLRTYSNSGN